MYLHAILLFMRSSIADHSLEVPPPPLAYVLRMAQQTTQVGPYQVPAGTIVFPCIYSLLMYSGNWDAPTEVRQIGVCVCVRGLGMVGGGGVGWVGGGASCSPASTAPKCTQDVQGRTHMGKSERGASVYLGWRVGGAQGRRGGGGQRGGVAALCFPACTAY